LVEARTREMATQVAEAAEHQLKEQALTWLGKELPPLKQTIHIQITGGEAPVGLTLFDFSRGDVHVRRMELEGPLDRIMKRVLPHEITHVVLNKHFRRPFPRWADEGAAVLSEDADEHNLHRRRFNKLVQKKSLIPLRTLLPLREYPREIEAFYTQSLLLTRFLVELRDRATLLRFVKHGAEKDWDSAAKTHYGYRDVAELESAWWMWEGVLLTMRPARRD
jgi:hypothetical protein